MPAHCDVAPCAVWGWPGRPRSHLRPSQPQVGRITTREATGSPRPEAQRDAGTAQGANRVVSRPFSRVWGQRRQVSEAAPALQPPVRGARPGMNQPHAGRSLTHGGRCRADHVRSAEGPVPREARGACLRCIATWQSERRGLPHGALLQAALHLRARGGGWAPEAGHGGALQGSRRLLPSHSSAPLRLLVPSSLF